METAKTKKRKVTSAVTAVVVAAAIALSGTFAWQSISQRAINETAGSVNPGARLHDDFDGTNKDVYVENFADAADGEPIFARIRLDEYMETGMEAGENRGAADRKATSLVAGADINDRTTWKTHIPGADDDPFHAYWTWTTGGQTTYMPTFNKNKDSLEADINGTYEGTTADDDTHYDDYVDYSDPANASKTANAVYDADDNDIDEGESAVEGTNIMTAEETHTAAQTLNGTVMTMQEWQAAGSQPGAYWVYDADGWAYWAQAIQPGTATGLLLDGIELTTHPGENWYYGINAVAQFVTADDLGADNNTGFYDTTKGAAPSTDAAFLLGLLTEQVYPDLWREQVAAIEPGSADTVIIDGIEWYVLANDTTENQALLLSKNVLETRIFDADSTVWSGSDMQTYLNGEWLNSKSTLSAAAVETTLKTRSTYNGTDFTETTDKVFLLSEADVFGTQNAAAAQTDDYTYNGAKLTVPGGSWIATNNGTADWWWLRSPRGGANGVAVVYSDGNLDSAHCTNTIGGVRPALWINFQVD